LLNFWADRIILNDSIIKKPSHPKAEWLFSN
jgi:hypothetical protein